MHVYARMWKQKERCCQGRDTAEHRIDIVLLTDRSNGISSQPAEILPECRYRGDYLREALFGQFRGNGRALQERA